MPRSLAGRTLLTLLYVTHIECIQTGQVFEIGSQKTSSGIAASSQDSRLKELSAIAEK